MQNDKNNISDDLTPYEPALRNKEIDLIQAVITRMADNQFKVKGFCVTILGFFLYSLKGGSPLQLCVASFVILLGCYYMDCFYLKMERFYRMWFEFLMDKRSETQAFICLN